MKKPLTLITIVLFSISSCRSNRKQSRLQNPTFAPPKETAADAIAPKFTEAEIRSGVDFVPEVSAASVILDPDYDQGKFEGSFGSEASLGKISSLDHEIVSDSENENSTSISDSSQSVDLQLSESEGSGPRTSDAEAAGIGIGVGVGVGAAVGMSIGGIAEYQRFKPKPLNNQSSVFYSGGNDLKYQEFLKGTNAHENLNTQRRLNIAADKPKVTVVGGGPVGLLSALEAYKNGAREVVLVEGRTSYTREIVLRIDKDHLTRIRDIVGADEFQRLMDTGIFQRFSTDAGANPHIGGKGINAKGLIDERMAIRVQDLEKVLAAAAEDIAKKDPDAFKVAYGYAFEGDSGSHRVTSDGRHKLVLKKQPGTKGPAKFEIETDWLVGADTANSQVKRLGGIDTDIVSTKAYGGVAVFKNPDKNIFKPGTNPVVDMKQRFADIGDVEARKYLMNLGFPEDAVKFKSGDALAEMMPRTRLFIMNDVIYMGSEFSEDQWKFLKQGRDPDLLKGYYSKLAAKHFGGEPHVSKLSGLSFIDNQKFSMAAFPIQLNQAQNFWGEVQGGKNRLQVMVIGDSAAETHFFTGTGVNRGFDDSSRIGSMVRDNTGNFKQYNQLTQESVSAMFNKSYGKAGAPPDAQKARRFMTNLDETVKRTDFRQRNFNAFTPDFKKKMAIGASVGAIIGAAGAAAYFGIRAYQKEKTVEDTEQK